MESTTTPSSENKKYSPILIAVITIALYAIITLIFHPQMVSGDSMIPTYSAGDIVWCKKMPGNELGIGDVAVVTFENIKCIKRLIAKPGNSVIITNGQIRVDGIEVYPFEDIEDPGIIPVSENGQEPLVLKPDEYLFVGDNRNYSTDGRYFGLISEKDIKYMVLRKIF